MTSWPCSISLSVRWDPKKPAPPVTSTRTVNAPSKSMTALKVYLINFYSETSNRLVRLKLYTSSLRFLWIAITIVIWMSLARERQLEYISKVAFNCFPGYMAWNTISEHQGGEVFRAEVLRHFPDSRSNNEAPLPSDRNKIILWRYLEINS